MEPQSPRPPQAQTPSQPQGSRSGPSGPAGRGGSSGGRHSTMKWIAAVVGIVIAIFAVAEIRKTLNARQRQQHAQPTTAATLALGVEERRELGLSPQATHGEIWAAARKQPLERIQLCAGSDTVIVTHGMGTGDQASVNGTTVNVSSNGYQPISIPPDAVAVQITGLSGEGGEVLFVLDTLPNQRLADIGTTQNSCDLKESHHVVAVKVDEIATIRIVR